MIQKIELALQKVHEYFNQLKLKISPEKTKFIIFTKSPFPIIQNYSLNVDGNNISLVKTVKYLGLTMDFNLTWNDHAKNIIGKATKMLNILKALRGTWWGGHPKILLTIYTALIRSTIEYSLFLIHISNSTLRSILQIIQNQAIRLALGYRRSTTINVMHAESKLPFINFRTQLLADKFILKVLSFNDSPVLQKIKKLDESLKTSDRFNTVLHFPLIKSYREISSLTSCKIQTHTHPIPYNYDYSAIIDDIDIDINSGTIIKKSDNTQHEFENIFNNTLSNHYAIFTDASKIPTADNAGLAFYTPFNNEYQQFKIHLQASIFTAEALAILMAIHHIIFSKQKKSYYLLRFS